MNTKEFLRLGVTLSEATWRAAAFRAKYPKGRNYVISPLTGPAYDQVIDGLKVKIVSPAELRLEIA